MLKKVYKKFESILLTLFSLGSVELHSLHILLNFFKRNIKNYFEFSIREKKKIKCQVVENLGKFIENFRDLSKTTNF